MNFSPEHLQAICQVLEKSPISRQEMRENIIDHLACAVDHKLQNGASFESALSSALKELAPNGLKEIELETNILLQPKTIIMKKLTYLSGLLFSIAASCGFIFKILHLPGANELSLIGFGGLAVVFAPLVVMVRLTTLKSNLDRLREGSLILSIILIAASMILKIFHLMGAEGTLLTGLVMFTGGFLPLTFLKMYRESLAS